MCTITTVTVLNANQNIIFWENDREFSIMEFVFIYALITSVHNGNVSTFSVLNAGFKHDDFTIELFSFICLPSFDVLKGLINC